MVDQSPNSMSLADYPQWVSALDQLTAAFINSETDVEEKLKEIGDLILHWVHSETALLFLPSLGGDWACEFTAGANTEELFGLPFPPKAAVGGAFADGKGTAFESLASSPLDDAISLSGYGPVVLAPLASDAGLSGALVLLRRSGDLPFSREETALVEMYTRAIILALRMFDVENAVERSVLLEERERISRDLHDYVIQEIFGVGIGLDRLRAQAEEDTLSPSAMVDGLKAAMRSLEDSVLQIRRIVYTLHEDSDDLLFAEHLENETSRARTILGFAPSLVFELDGVPLTPNSPAANAHIEELSDRIPEDIATDAAAMVREALSNVARHAHARSASVNIAVSGKGIIGELLISVVDDGTGVEPSQSRNSGMDNMSRRAALHGGSFAIGAGPRGHGTSLVWRVPLG